MEYTISSLDDVVNIVYINLYHRVDRKEHVQKEASKIGIQKKITRFNATDLPKNPALGCSLSHFKCIEKAIIEGWSHIMILEDDIVFLEPDVFKDRLNKFLKNNKNWDVLLLGGNNMLPYIPNDDTSIQVMNCLTTTGYIVKRHYFETLRDNYKEGINQLIRDKDNKKEYAIDKHWLKLQKRDKWYLLLPLTVIQMENYSDIEGKVTNFKNYFLDYNKVVR
jgi:GR25 family glycosyltransferase involved in LPS biosynthesis